MRIKKLGRRERNLIELDPDDREMMMMLMRLGSARCQLVLQMGNLIKPSVT